MILELLKRLGARATAPDPQHLTALAAAVLLLEVSWADNEIEAVELGVIERTLRERFDLDESEINELIAEARKDHVESVGVFDYTRTINANWDEAAKFDLIVALWRLAFADDDLNRYEEHTIRRIAELLYVSHERFIEAKLSATRND